MTTFSLGAPARTDQANEWCARWAIEDAFTEAAHALALQTTHTTHNRRDVAAALARLPRYWANEHAAAAWNSVSDDRGITYCRLGLRVYGYLPAAAAVLAVAGLDLRGVDCPEDLRALAARALLENLASPAEGCLVY